mmetsp:Transcript_4827/g.12358  ORF Transcript_4827/g.12358 Transcript_4827/m.12358 type:complete len:352 (-) Transcript_4827:11-1066(-)
MVVLKQVMDDLCSRFVINIQDDEMDNPTRIFFMLEQACWYYDDFYRKEHPSLPKIGLRDFALAMFRHYKPFQHFTARVDDMYTTFKKYKRSVPVCGALLLNAECSKVLMVKGYGIHIWGFPKGKINQDEPLIDCAVREVEEETGYNFGKLADPTAFVEVTQEKKPMTLFIVPGVPEDYPFEPISRNEVGDIRFVKLSKLENPQQNKKMRLVNAATQVVTKLRKWLATPAGKDARRRAMGEGGAAPMPGEAAAAPASSPPDQATAEGRNTLNKLLLAMHQRDRDGDGEAAAATTTEVAAPAVQAPWAGVPGTAVPLQPPPVQRGSPSMIGFRFDVNAVMQPFAAVRSQSPVR